MKIAISSTGKTTDNSLDTGFGRCEYFQIHEPLSENILILENKGNIAIGGAGIAAAQQIIDERNRSLNRKSKYSFSRKNTLWRYCYEINKRIKTYKLLWRKYSKQSY